MSKYLPSAAQISQNVVSTAIAMVVFAYVVAKVPALRDLVLNYRLPSNQS